MASVNKVILVGNLGRDPEIRYMPNGDAVANFSIATTDHWKDKNGQQQERTEWHNIVLFRRLAEIAGEYLKKGASVYIEGSLQTRKWQNKEGEDRYTTEIRGDSMQMLGSRQSGDSHGHHEREAPRRQPEKPNEYAAQSGRSTRPPASTGGSNFDDFEDDIPF